MSVPIFVFDIDNTLTSEWYRNDHVTDLKANGPILNLALAMQKPGVGRIAIVTARPARLKWQTQEWIRKQGLKPEVLLMRDKGDIRPDHQVRVDQVRTIQGMLGSNIFLYDDKEGNCRAVEEQLGVPCVHVRQ